MNRVLKNPLLLAILAISFLIFQNGTSAFSLNNSSHPNQGNGNGNGFGHNKVRVKEISPLVLPNILIPESGTGKLKIMPNGALGAGSNIDLVDMDFRQGVYHVFVKRDEDVEVNITPQNIPSGVEVVRFLVKLEEEPIRQHFPFRRRFNFRKKAYILQLGVELKVDSNTSEGKQDISYKIEIN